PTTPRAALELYVYSGLVGAMIPPQFWMLAVQLFTVAQGRRLFGPIAAGGALGAVVGAGGASLALRVFSLSSLTLIAAGWCGVAALVLTMLPATPAVDDGPTATTGASGKTEDRSDDGTSR